MIGSSTQGPSLRTTAGSRITMHRLGSYGMPVFWSAARTRSRLVWMAETGRLIMVIPGRPCPMSISNYNNQISMQVAALYRRSYCLQYLRRLLHNGKIIGVKIGLRWWFDKSALNLYIEPTQDTTDLPPKTLILLSLFVNYCIIFTMNQF